MTETRYKSLKEILDETMELRALNIQKLAQLTEIPERYLVAIYENDSKKLPPAPYIRGYLMKIAQALRVDGQTLWEIYKIQTPIKTSGTHDKLPINRFAIKSRSKKLVVLGIIAVLVIIYAVWRGSELLGTPPIEITNPVQDNFITNSDHIKLAGKIDPKDKLTIDDNEIPVSETGRFEKDWALQTGPNAVVFKVKRFLGKEVKITKQIIYQP